MTPRYTVDMSQYYEEAFDPHRPSQNSLPEPENGFDAARLSAGSADNMQVVPTCLQDPPPTLRRSTRRPTAGGVSTMSTASLSNNSGPATFSQSPLDSHHYTMPYSSATTSGYISDNQGSTVYSYSTASGFRPVLPAASSSAGESGAGFGEYSLPPMYHSYPNYSYAWGQNSTSQPDLETPQNSGSMGFPPNSYSYPTQPDYHESYMPPPAGMAPFVPAYNNTEAYSSPLSSPPVSPLNPSATSLSETESPVTPRQTSLIVKLPLGKSTSLKNTALLVPDTALRVPKPRARRITKTTKRGLLNDESRSEQPKKKRSRQVSDEFVLAEVSNSVEFQEDSDYSTPQKKTKISRGPAKKSTKKNSEKKPASAKKPASEAYYERAQKVQEGKPESIGTPKLWADKRSQLCETLWFYRAYQSAAHTMDSIAYGFMCDMEVGIRDKFDEEIVITRVGGGRAKDENGKMVQAKDQDKLKTALAFMRSKEMKIPVVFIAGMGNHISPSKLKHYYSVLDWFQTTDVWCEIVEGYKCWMVRLEKINLAERSWWAVQGTSAPASSFEYPKTSEQECTECHVTSKHIYNVGWTCLQQDCVKFFDVGSRFVSANIDYTSAFLSERTLYEGQAPPPLIPRLLPEKLSQAKRTGIEAIPKNGFVCIRCGCCSRQLDWSSWTCENPSCGHTHSFIREIISVGNAIADGMSSALAKEDSNSMSGGIRVSQLIKGLYDVYDYTIPGEKGEGIGFVRLFKANSLINQQPDGPNDLFLWMQQADFGLRRNPARQSGGVGEILTNHFSMNWGAPYKYGVKQISKTFADAPEVILKSLMRMTWAGQQTLGNQDIPFTDFNEVLSLGYIEHCEINYHDDGEKTLGPTVATLSLGCSATMKFRPKAKSSINGPPLKGSNTHKPDVLSIKLEHGDIVIMHGELIQKYYEHAVTPHGKLRFALTSRYIMPERMENEAERVYAKVAGTIPRGFTYTYNGDVNAKPVPAPTVPAMDEIRNTFRAMVRVGELSPEMAMFELQQLLAELSILNTNGTGTESGSCIENAASHSIVNYGTSDTNIETHDAGASAEGRFMNEV